MIVRLTYTRERGIVSAVVGDRETNLERLVRERAVLAGKYRIDRLIGAGGMGTVVAATHVELDEVVAVKLLGADAAELPGIRERFVNEARATARLKGPHVARVRDVDQHADGTAFFVMEYLVGTDLERLLDRGPLPIDLAVDYVLQACEAIAEAHAVGIVHRDLKPANLFLAERDDGTQAIKVVDFGISTGVGERNFRLTTENSILGTPAYMSPEQMRSARLADSRSDIWSLGAVLYELVEGNQPFAADSFVALCVLIAVHDPLPMKGAVPPGLARAIRRCLEKDPAMRFQTVGELARALLPYGRELHLAGERMARIERLARARTPAPIAPVRRPSDGLVAAIRDARTRALEHAEVAALPAPPGAARPKP